MVGRGRLRQNTHAALVAGVHVGAFFDQKPGRLDRAIVCGVAIIKGRAPSLERCVDIGGPFDRSKRALAASPAHHMSGVAAKSLAALGSPRRNGVQTEAGEVRTRRRAVFFSSFWTTACGWPIPRPPQGRTLESTRCGSAEGNSTLLSVRCAILCLERASESKMDSMNGQHGNGGTRDSQAAVLSVLLSILASKRVVLDRQHGRNRLGLSSASPMDSAK